MRPRAILPTILLALASLIGAGCSTVGGEIRELESDDAEDRREALADLGERLEEGVSERERAKILAALQRSLEDRNSVVRMIAVDLLGSSGDRPSSTRIVPLLQDKAWGVRHASIIALRRLEAKDTGSRMARLLREDPKGLCRLEAAKTLGAFRSEEGIEACIVALSERESDAGVRHAAWEALRAISGEELPARPDVWRRWWADHQAVKAAPPEPPAPGTPPADGAGGDESEAGREEAGSP